MVGMAQRCPAMHTARQAVGKGWQNGRGGGSPVWRNVAEPAPPHGLYMTFPAAVRTCFRKYFAFSGRARRSEYWWFVLFYIVVGTVLTVVDARYLGGGGTMQAFRVVDPGTGITGTGIDVGTDDSGPLATIFGLVMIVPLLSSGWRRMHDTGRSGLYLLYPLIVMVGVTIATGLFVGFDAFEAGRLAQVMAGAAGLAVVAALIVLFVSPLLVLWWLCRPGQPHDNAYGPPPLDTSPAVPR